MAMSIGEKLKNIVSENEGPTKVKLPSGESGSSEYSEEITPIPKIADENVKEIETTS